MPVNYAAKLQSLLIVPQPTRVVPHPPEEVVHQSTDGGYIGFARAKGWWFEVEWGQDVLDDEAIVAIKALYDAYDVYDIVDFAFTWFSGGEFIYSVIWDEEVSVAFKWSSVAEKLTIVLYEAA